MAEPSRTPTPAPAGLPVRLRAALAALVCAVGLLAAVHGFVAWQISRQIERFNADAPPEKLTGVALQQQAFRSPALLPVYGSSELTQPQTNRPDEFFGAHPTGFGTFLIGNPGETDLIIATKLAALGSEVRGRKAVVFLSPGWFLVPQLDPLGFGNNFSPLQGGLLAFGSGLSAPLKQEFARRLLDYPATVSQSPLLKASLGCVAENTPLDRFLLATMAPLGALQNRLQSEMDYGKVGVWLLNHRRPGAHGLFTPARASIDWGKRLREIDAGYTKQPLQTTYSTGPRTGWDDARSRVFRDPQHPEVAPDDNFERACIASKEWTDLALLLRTAHELKIRLLIVCQPLNAKFCQVQGLTSRSSELFYNRLRDVTSPYKVPLLTFPQGEHDPHFYHDSVHPSAKGWLTYDQSLDDFYHAPEPPVGS